MIFFFSTKGWYILQVCDEHYCRITTQNSPWLIHCWVPIPRSSWSQAVSTRHSRGQGWVSNWVIGRSPHADPGSHRGGARADRLVSAGASRMATSSGLLGKCWPVRLELPYVEFLRMDKVFSHASPSRVGQRGAVPGVGHLQSSEIVYRNKFSIWMNWERSDTSGQCAS